MQTIRIVPTYPSCMLVYSRMFLKAWDIAAAEKQSSMSSTFGFHDGEVPPVVVRNSQYAASVILVVDTIGLFVSHTTGLSY